MLAPFCASCWLAVTFWKKIQKHVCGSHSNQPRKSKNFLKVPSFRLETLLNFIVNNLSFFFFLNATEIRNKVKSSRSHYSQGSCILTHSSIYFYDAAQQNSRLHPPPSPQTLLLTSEPKQPPLPRWPLPNPLSSAMSQPAATGAQSSLLISLTSHTHLLLQRATLAAPDHLQSLTAARRLAVAKSLCNL